MSHFPKIIKMDNGKIELSMKKKGPKRNKVSSRHGGRSFRRVAALAGIIIVAVVMGLILGIKFASS